jgi:branched-chain amino acid transport system permease protein
MLDIGDMLISVPKLWGFVTAVITAAAVYWFLQKNTDGQSYPRHKSRPRSRQPHGH